MNEIRVQCTGGMTVIKGNQSTMSEIQSQCHSAHYKAHMDYPGIKSVPLEWQVGNLTALAMAGLSVFTNQKPV